MRQVFLTGVLALAASSAAAVDAVAEEAADAATAWRFGAGIGAGVGLFQGDIPGPWLEARGLARWAPGSALYFKGDLSLSYSTHSQTKSLDYDGDLDDDENTDERAMVALVPRVLVGIPFSRRFALEAGGFAGPAWTTLSSTQCGESQASGAAFGATAGPAFSLGSSNEIDLALHVDLVFTPLERCTNSSDASFEAGLPPSPHLHSEDDGQFAFVLRAHYLF